MPDTQQLLDEVSLRARDDGAGGRMQQHTLVGRQPVRAHDEHLAAHGPAIVARTRLCVSHQRLQVLLHAWRIGHRLIVQQYEVDGETLEVPVLVRRQQLAQQAAIIDVVDPREDDRPVTGDPEPPQARDRQRVRLQRSLRGPQRGIVVQRLFASCW